MSEPIKTLAEFKRYCDHERDHGRVPPALVIDNDDCAAYDQTAGEDMFNMHPHDLLQRALDLLGITYEHV